DVNKDNEVACIAYGLNIGFYAGQRELEAKNWKSLSPSMFRVFLSCQQMMGSWAHCAHNIYWKEDCNWAGPCHMLDVLDL
ncbi:hypothetical protein DFH28DRAFT_834685, partial [Melampsora americana]